MTSLHPPVLGLSEDKFSGLVRQLLREHQDEVAGLRERLRKAEQDILALDPNHRSFRSVPSLGSSREAGAGTGLAELAASPVRDGAVKLTGNWDTEAGKSIDAQLETCSKASSVSVRASPGGIIRHLDGENDHPDKDAEVRAARDEAQVWKMASRPVPDVQLNSPMPSHPPVSQPLTPQTRPSQITIVDFQPDAGEAFGVSDSVHRPTVTQESAPSSGPARSSACCVPSSTRGRTKFEPALSTSSLSADLLHDPASYLKKRISRHSLTNAVVSMVRVGTNQAKGTVSVETQDEENKSEIARLLGQSDEDDKPDRFMMSPVSKTRLTWDVVAFAVLLLDLWLTPFELVYLDYNISPPLFDNMSILLTFFWITDMLLNFTTGYIDRDKLIMRRRPSIRKYMRWWFWVDLVATIPYDILLGAAVSSVHPGFLSMARLSKVTKVFKTIRFLKMFRALRAVQSMTWASHFMESFKPLTYFSKLARVIAVLAVTSHLHACVWVALQADLHLRPSYDEALEVYFESFRWALNVIALGDIGEATNETGWVVLYEMIVASERIVAVAAFGAWAVTKAMTALQDDLQFNILKKSAMRFFRKHNVTIETQIQVMYSLFETRTAQKEQRHFQQLMDENLPQTLKRTVCEELWVPHLLTLGLMIHIKDWGSGSFINELCLRVHEEVIASKTVLWKQDSPSIAAYYIIEGCLSVVMMARTQEFTDGMWVGEQAFVSMSQRRTTTVVARSLSRLMTVPTNAFHELLKERGLQDDFGKYKDTHLQLGLCGRCGDVGDHFTHVCPLSMPGGAPWRFSSKPRGAVRRTESLNLGSGLENESDHLQAFLHGNRLTSLQPVLERIGIATRDDLNAREPKMLLKEMGPLDESLKSQVDLLIALLEEQRRTEELLFNEGEVKSEHYVFLSHFKMEAGTEAALMRSEMETLFRERGDEALFEWFNSPIFLDTEDLSSLKDLEKRVRKTHNLVLLLSKGVLTRPWCVVELVTAVRNNVRIIPVRIDKPGSGWVDLEKDFYDKLVNRQVFGEDAEAILRSHGISLQDVADAIQHALTNIQLWYSPHKSEAVRKGEVKSVVSKLRPRDMRSARRDGTTSANLGEGGESPRRRNSRPEIKTMKTSPAERKGRSTLDQDYSSEAL
eukprot:CAMPEP_0206530510 /NCGR_PEP_ID=MMETSP0325_2-20121206/3220_1 /ASSEMBLY_ACC=CAM_ASM_000347 /TAXON_ID=2866 /ORGANISM="Crypthecodinium cohnii, Strain Seligo" /LENGTH=1136 /DNA_ID=CAMNT_0054026591 /DNA_START=88 /DNA_END=3499 /DNA_ORIENTATION=+